MLPVVQTSARTTVTKPEDKHVADYDITNSVGVEDPQYANQACLSVDRCPAMGRCAWCAKSNAGLALGWCLCGLDKHVTCG